MRIVSLALLGAIAGASGCAATTPEEQPMAEADERKVASATSFLDNPPEIYTNSDGVRFRLVGPAQVGLVPRGGVSVPEQAQQDGAPAASPTLTELAERLRPVMLMGGRWEYVGEEPAYDLAEAILRNEAIEPQTPVREGRIILGPTCGAGPGPCDNRAHFTGSATSGVLMRPTLFIEHGCSGTMIGRSTAITAAHCMYNTNGNFWYVVDGISCSNTGESSANNTEDRRPFSGSPPVNTQNCLPRFAAGMNSDGAPLGWLSCYNVTINTAYRNAVGDANIASAQNDYAVIDFNTEFCSNDFPGDTTGWRGTWIAAASDFAANSSMIVGYPGRSNPGNPDNSGGSAAGFPIRFTPNNCGSLSGNAGTEASSFPNCTAAMQVGMTGDGGSFWIDPLGNGTWQIGTSTLDTSGGQSGSGYVLFAEPTTNRTLPSEAGTEYLVGIHRGADSGWNIAHAWDMTVRNFVATNSDDL